MNAQSEPTTYLGDAPKEGWNNDYTARDFWNVCHEKKSLTMLSGNSGKQIISNLRIEPFVKSKINLLNIGVGVGICTNDYKKLGCKVSVMDISDVAIAKVKDIVEAGYLATNMSELPRNKFDLAISHLVAQHTEDKDLQANLEAVIASLTPKGMYAIQICYPLGKEHIKHEWKQSEAKAGSITRTCAKFAGMVEAAGGMIENMFTIDIFPEYNVGWYGCHIRKN